MVDKKDNCVDLLQLALPFEVSETPTFWRPIHYLGSKLRLADSISNLLDEIDPTCGTVCDLFAGSGTVSMKLSAKRRVLAADIQEYSRVLCSALLSPTEFDDVARNLLFGEIENQKIRLEKCLTSILEFEQCALESATIQPKHLCTLIEKGSLLSNPVENDPLSLAIRETNARIGNLDYVPLATRYFGGVYFSYTQTLYLDSVLASIKILPISLKDTCLAAVLSTASTIVNSIGKQFAQPIRPRKRDGSIKEQLISQICRDRTQNAGKVFTEWIARYRALPFQQGNKAIRGDFHDVLNGLGDVSVIYADPPYTRDHYSRFYHVLETLSLRDLPRVSTTSLTGEGDTSRGLYRVGRHQSPFCIKSQAPTAFRDLFVSCKKHDAPLLVSYSPFVKDGHPRLMAVEAIAELAADYYSDVQVMPANPIAHSKLNKTELHLEASNSAEVFIVCR